MEKVAKTMGEASDPGGVDASQLQLWLKQYGSYSKALREEVALLGEWMANGTPPWAAIRALMIGRLLGMNKFPGVRPLGCGEAWRRLLAKVFLAVTITEVELECGIEQLCGRLRAGIEGGVHDMRTMWDLMKSEEEMGFLLTDARNAFNEVNRT